jgi:ribosomal protein L32
MASLTTGLSATAPIWGRAVAPMAEWVAQEFWASTRKRASHGASSPPTRLTQRRRTEGRGKQFAPKAHAAPVPEKVCRSCGTVTRQGQRCPKCGREISREKLIELAKIGRLAAQHPESRRKQAESQSRHRRAQEGWRSGAKPSWLTESVFTEEIQPRLASVTISSLASAIGVSESYAADIRAGRHRPHPRHWQILSRLVHVEATNLQPTDY